MRGRCQAVEIWQIRVLYFIASIWQQSQNGGGEAGRYETRLKVVRWWRGVGEVGWSREQRAERKKGAGIGKRKQRILVLVQAMSHENGKR
jgi:hypothetical protein